MKQLVRRRASEMLCGAGLCQTENSIDLQYTTMET